MTRTVCLTPTDDLVGNPTLFLHACRKVNSEKVMSDSRCCYLQTLCDAAGRTGAGCCHLLEEIDITRGEGLVDEVGELAAQTLATGVPTEGGEEALGGLAEAMQARQCHTSHQQRLNGNTKVGRRGGIM
ncbi:unnamed protein product [Protopolystoma xenopodis]|uniref:Uncharacterized protein n=1 Tax=Protopolystoma xenopodis TaxID=117903 RepID=A0A3S5AC17_9PLAT|nr:unnamed protein product [Protopolystoma xenopodis]